jgi:hypothetical protein
MLENFFPGAGAAQRPLINTVQRPDALAREPSSRSLVRIEWNSPSLPVYSILDRLFQMRGVARTFSSSDALTNSILVNDRIVVAPVDSVRKTADSQKRQSK